MSKTDKAEKASKTDKAEKTSNLPKRPEYKYNAKTLAEELDMEGSEVRRRLRNLDVDLADGGVYGWNTKDEYTAVKTQIKDSMKKKAKAEDEKPAKADKKDKKSKD